MWMPPEGAGRALGCIATTFTFDPDFFEQQCLGRFLGLDARPGESAGDIGYLIEREEKLAETPVCLIADRGLNPDARSLRWDVLPAAHRTGVMHAKVALLVWERCVRTIVASANLVESSFRSSIELAVAFDAFDGAELPRPFVVDLLGTVRRVVALTPVSPEATGPRERADSIVTRAAEVVAGFALPERAGRGSPRLAVVSPSRGRDAVDGLMETWSGGPPKRASVMSPYFDRGDRPSRAGARLTEVLAKRSAEVRFIVPVEHLSERDVVQVPAALLDSIPKRIPSQLLDVRQPEPKEPRRLHGKLILLESDTWVSALVGSSNFSAAGLGLGGGGNLEIGVAVGAPSSSDEGRTLKALALPGEPVSLEEAELEGVDDPDEVVVQIPAGFVQVLGEPGPPPELHIELDPTTLPPSWSIDTPDGRPLLDSVTWKRRGSPRVAVVSIHGEQLPFNVALRWDDDADTSPRVNFPVNVTDPARLPPPEELRSLPVDAVLRALASTRPLHEGIVKALARPERRPDPDRTDEMDPLKRFSPSGQLLHRTRELSAALAGLKARLERPAATLDAFLWRVHGTFGPVEIGRRLVEERRLGRSLAGEEAFMLAEIGLTLASVELDKSSRFIPDERKSMRSAIRNAAEELQALCVELDEAPELRAYVHDAFKRAAA